MIHAQLIMENKVSNEEIISDIINKFHIEGNTPENIIKPFNEATENIETVSEKNSLSEEVTTKEFSNNDAELCKDKEPDFIEDVDEEKLKSLELDMSQRDIEENWQNALELKAKGNEEFNSKNYIDCINLYTKALRVCPTCYKNDRSILYGNRAAAKLKLNYTETAIEDCTKAIELNPNYIKVYLRRAKLFETSDKLDESLNDFKKIIELDPSNAEAKAAVIRLPPLINERNEKLKEDMLGKLKDLGNLVLKPFGLSTENFKLQQDPNTGGYSVNFQQNKR